MVECHAAREFFFLTFPATLSYVAMIVSASSDATETDSAFSMKSGAFRVRTAS